MEKKVSYKDSIDCLKQLILPRGFVWIQTSGGNVSIKQNDLIYIKPSGISINEFSAKNVAIFNRKKFLQLFNQIDPRADDAEIKYADAIKQSQCIQENILRPSMEAGFHALLSKKYVIHLHSIAAILIYHSYKKGILENWLSEKTNKKICFIKKTIPGFRLTKAIENDIKADWYFLENHGLIINTNDPNDIENVGKLEELFLEDFGFSEVAYFYRNPFNLNELFAREFPWSPIFPDSFVFMDQLLDMTIVSNKKDFYKLKNLDKNNKLLELWAAMILLNKAAPDLDIWTESECEAITKMPTEIHRKRLALENE